MEEEEASDDEEMEVEQSEDLHQSDQVEDLVVQLTNSLQRATAEGSTKPKFFPSEGARNKSIVTIVKKERDIYQEPSTLSAQLHLLQQPLLTLHPTSIKWERAFSLASQTVNKLRSRLSSDMINSICFLNGYYKKNT